MKKTNLFFQITLLLFGVLFVASMIFYFHYNATSHKPRQVEHSYVYFNSWEVVHDDGSREPVELPSSFNCKNDEKLVIEAILPEVILETDWLNFNNGYDMDLYIDGELRKSFREADSDIPGGVVKGLKQFCKLYPEDAGKVIRIERDKRANYSSDILIGDSLGLVSRYLLQGAASYVAIILLCVVAILVVIFGIIIRKVNGKDNSLIALGFGVGLGALWLLFDSPMYQFVFDNYYIDGVMAYMMSMLMPFPFLVCVNTLQEKRHTFMNSFLALILLINAVVASVLHFAEIIEFEYSQGVVDGVLVFCLVGFMSTLTVDFIKHRVENKVQVYGLFIGIFCAAIEIIVLNLVEGRIDGAFIILGLWIVLVSAVIQQVINLWKSERERQSAIHANKVKSDFLAKMSHEIRTPINAVLGMDEMILRDCNDPAVTQYASDIKIATNNLLSIINEILDSSKIESGKMEIIPVKYKMAIMLNDLYNMIFIKSEEKQLKLFFEVDESIPSEYFGDDVRIRQVLINLLTNAVKYTNAGEVRLKLTAKKDGDKAILKFSVVDTGMGIKEKDIATLFDAYQRVDEKRNRYVEGTGLGMSITHQLLKLMGSELKVKSTYGKGSEFSFELEQGIENASPLGNFRDSEERHVGADKVMDFEAPDAKILVVDDNRMNRKVFSLLLKNVHMQITDAENGEECLDYMCKEKYDMIFLDHMMPEMDGIEVLARIKNLKTNKNAGTPIIMFTANAIQGAKEFYQENGAVDYISKPVKPDELEKLFVEYLDASLIHRK